MLRGRSIRKAAVVFCFLSAVVIIYQLRSSIRLIMFHHTSTIFSEDGGEEQKIQQIGDENNAGETQNVFLSHKKQSPEFGEQHQTVRRKADSTMSKVPNKMGANKLPLNMNSNKIKKLVSNSFTAGLASHADGNKQIVVDYGFHEFAVNFKELSIDRLNITNFLLICTDKHSHLELNFLGISCCYFDYGNTNSEKPSDFGTKDYFEKTNVKTAVMIQALSLGYSVLIIDLDVILFQNPFPFFTCLDCDIHIQMDRDLFNSGFVYVHPTVAAQTLYDYAWNLYIKYHKAHDQAYINMAVAVLKNENHLPKIHSLSTQKFPCGVYYFEHGNRMFENMPSCPECVMAHNNYLGSTAAKIYRFKENLLWMVDSDAYYSNSSRKYLIYDNPIDFGLKTMEVEVAALKTALALAMATDRIVILPTFRCCNCNPEVECSHSMHRCSLLSVLRLKPFDDAFHNLYREHSFLKNPKVPLEVKNSLSPCLLINSSSVSSKQLDGDCIVFQPTSYNDGATVEEIHKWFRLYENTSVLQFHSLYGAFSTKQFHSDKQFTKLKLLTDEAFKCSDYEQWEEASFKF